MTQLASRGAALFPSWAQALHTATGIDPEYEASGMLVLPPFNSYAAQQWCRAHDVPFELVQATQIVPKRTRRGILLAGSGAGTQSALDACIARSRGNAGGRIIEQCEVRNIVAENGLVQTIETSSGEFSADNYIVTAGAWSKQVLGQYALKMEIKPIRGQMLLFKFLQPPLRHIILQKEMYLIPRRDGHLLVGSTLEDVGFDKMNTQDAHDNLRLRAEALLPR
ncbi:MAG: FAD-dependent oxidoreductase [Nitrosomonadales bacterium]